MSNFTKKISPLHFVTQNSAMSRLPWEQAELACKGGATWVSLRTTQMSYGELLPTALKTQEVCKHFDATYIINNNVLLAKEINADGVHLGTRDIPVDQARQFLGDHTIIGATANSFDDIKRAVDLGADYVAVGPTRFSKSKELTGSIISPSKFLTIKRMCIQQNITTPLIATGGVSPEDLEIFLDLGLNGISVSSGINMSQDPTFETKDIITKLHKKLAW